MALVFLDLETTGLDPKVDRILEIAAVRVDESTLDPVEGYTSLVRPNPGVQLPAMDDYVQSMHTDNGLLAELDAGSGKPLREVQQELCERLHAWGPPKHTLAGDSVHFDLGFLREWMPVAAGHFSHRLLDTTAFGVGRRLLGLPDCPIVAANRHRATGDVLASIAKARWHLSRVTP